MKSTRKVLYLLDRCLTQMHVKQIQSHLTVSGTLFDPYAVAKIVSFFAASDCSDLSHAFRLFCYLPYRTTYIWNTMMRAFTERAEPSKTLFLYDCMHKSGLLPNNYTFSFLLRACADLSDLSLGLVIHGQAIRMGWESYDFVQNGLIHLYTTCHCMGPARKLFDASIGRDVVTWTSLINGYVKCGKVVIARQLFDQMPEKNSVSWSAMINGYAQVGLFRESLELFSDMQVYGFQPNHAGIVGALTSCAFLGALEQGRWIHAYVERIAMQLDRVLGTAFIDMYAKCGCITAACTVFDEMLDKDVYAFTSLISGLANHGQSDGAIKLFMRMQKEGVMPNDITFIGVLSACSRMGLVDEGLRIFDSMKNIYSIEPGAQHYGCLVDLLGRAGMLEEAKRVVRDMPVEPDSYVLGALLNASRVHGDVELGKEMAERLAQLGLDRSGVHVLLSNMYASVDRWDYVAQVRNGMEKQKVIKVPGCSAIEVDGLVHEFVAGDKSYLLMEDTMLMSHVIDKHLKYIWVEHNADLKIME